MKGIFAILGTGIFFFILLTVPQVSAQSLIETITVPDSNIFLGMELYQPGGKLFLVDHNYPRILVYDSNSFAFLKEISFSSYLPLTPWGCAIQESSGTLYVSMLEDDWDYFEPSIVLVVDSNTYTVKDTISVSTSGFPKVDENHGRLYIYSVDALTAIDLASYIELGSLDLWEAMGGDGLIGGFNYNPVTGEWVYPNLHQEKFMVVDGLTLAPEVISVNGARGWSAVWNLLENKVCIVRMHWDYFVYDRDTGESKTFDCGNNDAGSLFFSKATNRIYSDVEVNNRITIIDGVSDACQMVDMEGPFLDVQFVEGKRHAVYLDGIGSEINFFDEDRLKIAKSFPDSGSGYYRDSAVDQINQRVFAEFVDYTQNLSYILVFDYHEPSLAIISPDGGERWPAGSTHNITWKDTGTIANVKLEYSIDNGSTWTTIVDSTPNSYAYSWTLPNLGTFIGLVRISDTANPSVSDTSDAVFSIALPLGEAVDNTSLTWETGGDADWIGQSLVYYYGGSSAQSCPIDYIWYDESTYIQTTVSGPGNLSFYWKVSSMDYFDPFIFLIDDVEKSRISGEEGWLQKQYPISAGVHTLKWLYSPTWGNVGSDAAWLDKVEYTVLPVESITVTSPNGGELWLAGTTHDITWTQTGLSGTLDIDLYQGGSFDSKLGTALASSGSFSWSIPLSLPGGSDYKVRVYQGSVEDYSDYYFTITAATLEKDDVLGTWFSGVWYRNSETGSWVKMSSTANLVAAGDLDGDGIDDLIGVWSSGLWVKYSSSGSWAKLSSTLPTDIASGDMNGDGRDDILGSWSSGVWYRNSDTGSWVLMTIPAQMVTAGDLDGDDTDDLIGVWSSGLWVKYSSISSWLLVTPTLPSGIASGDMNGDGRDDILGTWPSGVWYRSSIGGGWVKMSSSANFVAAGDIDGDGKDDLIGTWSSGLWVKYSSTTSWQFICTSLPSDIDAGLFRTGWGYGAMSYEAPVVGVYAESPGNIDDYEDLSAEGPGGWNFVYQEKGNLMPQETEAQRIERTLGPGELGFKGIEQKNLVPKESSDKKRKKNGRSLLKTGIT